MTNNFFKAKQITTEKSNEVKQEEIIQPEIPIIEKEIVELKQEEEVIVHQVSVIEEKTNQPEIELSADEKLFKEFHDFHTRVQPWIDFPQLAIYHGFKK